MITLARAAGPVASGPAGIAIPAGVRVVVFDVVGTLVEPNPPVAVAYQRAAARHGVERGCDAIARLFREAWRRQEDVDAAHPRPFATSRDRERARWAAIVADVFPDVPDTDGIFRDLWDHFGRPVAWRPTTWGPALVRSVRDAGRAVALASNFDERLLAIAPHVPPLDAAANVFTSSELGWRKPAVEFFRIVEQRLACSPEELLLVGDDPDLDLAAGRRAGWHVHGVNAREPAPPVVIDASGLGPA